MATKKYRRFADGGDTTESDKAEGLKASSGEKVGFFDRLRMGNIDQEGSEAYKRFGAGRGKMERTPVEDAVAVPVTRAAAPEMDELEAANAREPIAVPAGPRASAANGKASVPGGKSSAAESKASTSQARDLEAGMSRGTRSNNPRDLEAGMSRGRRGEGAPKTTIGRTPSRAGTASDIPGSAPEGWKGGTGDRVDSTELGRNYEALMNAAGPGRMATGLTLAAREAQTARAAQKAYNARAEARRAAEGLNAVEAAAAKQTLRENKTLNPLSWMAGPKGMAENFKRGGKVKAKTPAKKMSSGGTTSQASRRGDGIALRGKTRGGIY